MKLVVDTNIIISALISDRSDYRYLIRNLDVEFVSPAYVFTELTKHQDLIVSKSKLTKGKFYEFFDILLENIEEIPFSEYAFMTQEAQKIIGNRDTKDVAFVALALALKCEGIWSNDKHFRDLNGIKTFTTNELLELKT